MTGILLPKQKRCQRCSIFLNVTIYKKIDFWLVGLLEILLQLVLTLPGDILYAVSQVEN
jgi:hypothetical protein